MKETKRHQCIACENPSHMGHAECCPLADDFIPTFDPWGWVDEPEKLDIQAGIRLKQPEVETA